MKNRYIKTAVLLPAILLASCASRLPFNEQAIYKDKFEVVIAKDEIVETLQCNV